MNSGLFLKPLNTEVNIRKSRKMKMLTFVVTRFDSIMKQRPHWSGKWWGGVARRFSAGWSVRREVQAVRRSDRYERSPRAVLPAGPRMEPREINTELLWRSRGTKRRSATIHEKEKSWVSRRLRIFSSFFSSEGSSYSFWGSQRYLCRASDILVSPNITNPMYWLH